MAALQMADSLRYLIASLVLFVQDLALYTHPSPNLGGNLCTFLEPLCAALVRRIDHSSVTTNCVAETLRTVNSRPESRRSCNCTR